MERARWLRWQNGHWGAFPSCSARIDAVAPFIAACSVPCRRQLCARSLRTCRRMLVSATSKATAHCSKGDLYSGPTLRCHNAATSKFLHRGIRIARNATSTVHSRYAATSKFLHHGIRYTHSFVVSTNMMACPSRRCALAHMPLPAPALWSIARSTFPLCFTYRGVAVNAAHSHANTRGWHASSVRLEPRILLTVLGA
jgi:hypothetical protein